MKKYFKLFAIICICLITALLSIEIYNYVNNLYPISKKKIQNKIYKFDKIADEIIDTYNFSDIDEDFNNLINKQYKTKFFNILIYKDSTLSYWSNNNSSHTWFLTSDFYTPISYTNNSIVYNKIYSKDSLDIIIQLPIKYTYNIENKYINNNFSQYLIISDKYEIYLLDDENTTNNTNNNKLIYNSNSEPLFKFDYKKKSNINYKSQTVSNIIFILFVSCFTIMMVFYTNLFKRKKKFLNILSVGLFLLFLRIIFYQITKARFFDTEIFEYNFLNFVTFLNSPGDAFISSIFLIIFSFIILINLKNIYLPNKFIYRLITWIIVIVVNTLIFLLIYNMLICSDNDIIFLKFTDLDILRSLLLMSIFFLTTAAIILTIALLKLIYHINETKILSGHVILIICIFSIGMTYVLSKVDKIKEYNFISKTATENIFVRNKTDENALIQSLLKIKQTEAFQNLSEANIIQNNKSIEINNLLRDEFREDKLSKFFTNYIIADSITTIRVNNDTVIYNCNDYFNNHIKENGINTEYENLYYIYDLMTVPYYIYKIESKDYTVWIDIIPKYNIDGIGYPELLSSLSNQRKNINLSELSIGIYKDNYLIRNLGNYLYYNELDYNYIKYLNNDKYLVNNNYKHYFFQEQSIENVVLVISKNYNVLKYYLSPFTYIFVFLLIIYFLTFIICNGDATFTNPRKNSLSQKIQNSSIWFFIAVSVFIGIFSIFLIININNNKNKSGLIEKTYSISKEIEKYLNNDSNSLLSLENTLFNIANIFFVDINLYDGDGYLVSTSNENMFLNNLTSNLINPNALFKIQNTNRFINNESIGNYKYMSSYMIVLDKYNNIYYLNIPYFTKQSQLKKEISNYLILFINIYTIIIFIIIIMTHFLSNYITKPLSILTGKLARVSLSNKNDKITYEINDEIGKLVEVYNNKVDELEKSAELLAKSERESAWREMARQVAHEIKNPLTPMKLSTQYLYKIWEKDEENFDEHLSKYINTMVHQIDTLSDIATAFNNFAKMPEAENDIYNINKVIKNALEVYDQTDVDINFNYSEKEINTFIDFNLFTIVFNNLISNSMQAFVSEDNNKKLKINIYSKIIDNKCVIDFTDNGPGIDNVLLKKIFLPNFTTKHSGSGLGLAIVSNIIKNANGTIECLQVKEGAHFRIILPLTNKEKEIF